MLTDPEVDLGGCMVRARANVAGCPPVLWINLDRHEGRRRHMERFLDALHVPWHRRIAAIDGTGDASGFAARVSRVEGADGDAAADRVHACLASHMLALARYVEEFPEAPYAIVMEDDVSFECAAHWPRTLGAYLEDAFGEWPDTAVQLSGIVFRQGQTGAVGIDPQRATRPPPDADARLSCAAYAIGIERARSLVARFVRKNAGGCSIVDLRDAGSPHAEAVVYGADALFLPLFPALGTDSDLYPVNPASHSFLRAFLTRFWEGCSLNV